VVSTPSFQSSSRSGIRICIASICRSAKKQEPLDLDSTARDCLRTPLGEVLGGLSGRSGATQEQSPKLIAETARTILNEYVPVVKLVFDLMDSSQLAISVAVAPGG